MEDKEAIYDEQIAPLMAQLIEVCQREGIPFFASFQYREDGFCTSAQSTGHCVFDSYLALAQCAEHGGVNVDKYMNWVAKDARKNGHSSMYLKMAGIPLTPDETPNTKSEPTLRLFAEVGSTDGLCGNGSEVGAGDTAHAWKVISPGEYDSLYECQRCGARHMEQLDRLGSEKPTFGCTHNVEFSGAQRSGASAGTEG